MTHSESIDQIAAALCKAQPQMRAALKSSDNPYFKSRYADLTAVWDACREALNSNGLSVVQGCEHDPDGLVALSTLLLHTSGQWIRGTITMRPVKADPQGIGSCITYARRYGLAAIAGVCTEDDDGNAASAAAVKPERGERDVKRSVSTGPSDEEQQRLSAICDAYGITGTERIKTFAPFSTLTGEAFELKVKELCDTLEKKREQSADPSRIPALRAECEHLASDTIWPEKARDQFLSKVENAGTTAALEALIRNAKAYLKTRHEQRGDLL